MSNIRIRSEVIEHPCEINREIEFDSNSTSCEILVILLKWMNIDMSSKSSGEKFKSDIDIK